MLFDPNTARVMMSRKGVVSGPHPLDEFLTLYATGQLNEPQKPPFRVQFEGRKKWLNHEDAVNALDKSKFRLKKVLTADEERRLREVCSCLLPIVEIELKAENQIYSVSTGEPFKKTIIVNFAKPQSRKRYGYPRHVRLDVEDDYHYYPTRSYWCTKHAHNSVDFPKIGDYSILSGRYFSELRMLCPTWTGIS
jgi:hypothetical protein